MNPPNPNPSGIQSTNPSGIPLLELRNAAIVSIENPGQAILEGVDWTISSGDYWVIGALPSSGKSDLLATMAGLRRPLRGSHRLFGYDNHAAADDGLREHLRAGLVFADGGRLFPQMTVAANVALPLCYRLDCSLAQAESQVQMVLELVGLIPLARQPAGRLGRAWRPRAALARALILQPEVLLLDNPLAGLDPRQVGWWLEFLNQLSTGHEIFNHRSLALAVATDDLRPWLTQGRQFAFLKDNRWLPVGDRAALAASEDPLIRELMAEHLVAG